MKLIVKISVLCFGLMVLGSCSTKKNTLVTRSYHNLTAHYNAFFNGREAYKQGIKKIEKNIKDDFSSYIPVFPYSDETAAKQAASDMNTAIEKAGKVIKLHSITAKPKRRGGKVSKKQREFYNKTEYCNWVDDSWYLSGKGQLVNHDFYAAEEAFEYVVKEYSSNEIRYDASIGLAKTYNAMEKFKDSKSILDQIEGEKTFPKRLRKELTLTYADLYLHEKKYGDVIPKLQTALSMHCSKREKARYNYLLAQLYQRSGQFSKASEYYTRSMKYNPPYDMVFSAQINRATCFDNLAGNAESLIKELMKMLKDDKNIDYKDQIYYAMAKLYQKNNDIDKAMECYKLSARNSQGNNTQKALSYFAVGEIYFAREKYVPAQAYYDSTMAVLDQKYSDYETISMKSKNIADLVKNLLVIQNEDSLQRIANLPERERNRIIENMIQEVIREEDRKKQEEAQQQMNSMLYMQNQQNMKMNPGMGGGKWYFYNPATMSFGMAEFKKKWGNRKNEDDWRRKNKAVVSISPDDVTAAKDSVKKPAFTDNKQKEFYTQHLPLTDSLKRKSNIRIEDALFNSGEAYMNKLKNYPFAVKQFETLNSRFPESRYLLQSYYYLYTINTSLLNDAEATKYRNLILQKFPESNYAKMLSNPNYLKELEAKKGEINRLYDQAYQEFRYRNYNKAYAYCEQADSLFSNNHISAKFSLLKALSTGGKGDLTGLKNSLNNIITKYPGTEEKTAAENILAYVSKGNYGYLSQMSYEEKNKTLPAVKTPLPKDTQPVKQNTATPQKQETKPTPPVDDFVDPLYKYDENEKQYFVILLDKNADVYKLKYNLFGYNIDYFSMFEFELSTGTWNERYQLIKVQPFASPREAVKYYKSVNKHKDVVFRGIDERQYLFFVISEKNIPLLQADKDMDHYQYFFTRKYLEKGK